MVTTRFGASAALPRMLLHLSLRSYGRISKWGIPRRLNFAGERAVVSPEGQCNLVALVVAQPVPRDFHAEQVYEKALVIDPDNIGHI